MIVFICPPGAVRCTPVAGPGEGGMGGWGAWGDKPGACVLPPIASPPLPRAPHPATKRAALPLPPGRPPGPAPSLRKRISCLPRPGWMSQELPTADGHTPASIRSHSPRLLPLPPSTGAQHPLPAHPLAGDPWPGPAPLCPLLLTPWPPPQKAGAGTPSLRPPAPFGSPHEPTPAPVPACSPAPGHRIRPSTRSPGWTAWTEAHSPWSRPCCWPSAASAPQVGVQGPGVGRPGPKCSQPPPCVLSSCTVWLSWVVWIAQGDAAG